MALPSKTPLDEVLRDARKTWVSLKIMAAGQAALFAAPASAGRVLEILPQLRFFRERLTAAASAPGIGDFAKDMYVDPAYDIGADFAAMMSALDAVGSWIIANFPRDASGYLLRETMAADGTVTERVMTAVQLAPLKTRLETLSATIE